jgi:ABC-type polysaccharide/polyol phosphate export permease
MQGNMNQISKIFYLTLFQMKSRYRKTFAGFLWVVSSPILTFVVQSLVFKSIFKFEINQYPLYLLSGLLPWFFISQTLYSSTTCLVASREVLLAFKIEPITIVAANVFDQFISFLAAFFIVSIFLIFPILDTFSFLRIMTIPIDLILILSLLLLFNSLLAFWYAFYRDINFITNFILGLVFYITPIFFLEKMFPENYLWILKVNIFIPFIKIFQTSIYSWNPDIWLNEVFKAILINILMAFLLKLSLKFKLKDFYVRV